MVPRRRRVGAFPNLRHVFLTLGDPVVHRAAADTAEVRRALSSVALIVSAVILASGTSLAVGAVIANPIDDVNGRFVVAGATQAVVLVLIALAAYRVLLTSKDLQTNPSARAPRASWGAATTSTPLRRAAHLSPVSNSTRASNGPSTRPGPRTNSSAW